MEEILQKLSLCHHFFSSFKNLKFRGIEVARFLMYEFIEYLASYDLNAMIKAIPDIKNNPCQKDVFQLVDGDYPCTATPGRKILIHPREFLRDIIPFLPSDRLILPVAEQAPNSTAVRELTDAAMSQLDRCSDDPLFGTEPFRAWLTRNLVNMVRETDQLADLFDREEISCVVARFAFHWPFYWPCRSLLWLAKSRGIPSVAYQPGVLIGCNSKSQNWWPEADIPIVATYKTVWGPFFRDFFMSFGIPETRLPIIGNPQFDRIRSYPSPDKAEFRRKYGIPATHKVILHPTQYPDSLRVATVRTAVEAVQALPDTTLLIKTRDLEYPAEKSLYEEIILDRPRIVVFGEDQAIDELIANSDVVLIFYTTTGFEAMLFEKPVVVLDLIGLEPPFSYPEVLGTLAVHDSTELVSLLHKIFTEPEFEKLIKDKTARRLSEVCIPDGKALQRMAELIMNVADGADNM